jgi:hypothetical protein
MLEDLSLSKEYKAKVYELELKKVYKRLFGKLKNAQDKDKIKECRNYKREIGRE